MSMRERPYDLLCPQRGKVADRGLRVQLRALVRRDLDVERLPPL